MKLLTVLSVILVAVGSIGCTQVGGNTPATHSAVNIPTQAAVQFVALQATPQPTIAPLEPSVDWLVQNSRPYFLRPGEDFESLRDLLVETSYTPVLSTTITAVLIQLNPGNVWKDPATSRYGFSNHEALTEVQIPFLPGFPSFSELGITPPTKVQRTHVVTEGDTLSDLASVYGFATVGEFAAAANIPNPEEKVLKIGEYIIWLEIIPASYDATKDTQPLQPISR